jgi:nitrate reductase NapE component
MATHPPRARTAKQEWAVGLTIFGAVMLMIAGILDIMRGIAAIAEDDVFLTTRNYVFQFDLTGWGWIHLALGALAVIVSLGLFQASTWARVAGVTIAGLIIIANFLSLPYYPVWSVVMIAMSGFIIWALCVVRKDESFAMFERSSPDT